MSLKGWKNFMDLFCEIMLKAKSMTLKIDGQLVGGF